MKNLFSFYKLLSLILLFAFSKGWSQGSENFETQTALTSTYANGTFNGETAGVTVNFVHSRDQDTYAISGKGIILRRSDEPSSVEFVIPNGVGDFTFSYRKAFTGGTNNRVLALFVDGVEQSPIVGPFGAAETDPTVRTSTFAVEKGGTVKIKISYPVGTTTGNRQITIDNVSWTSPMLCTPPTIGTNPSNTAVFANTAADFSVAATGNNLTYQWQESIDNGATWVDISGATANTYNTGATSVSMNGYQYRCVVSSGTCSVNSTAATLTVNEDALNYVNLAGIGPVVTYDEGTQTLTAYSKVYEPGFTDTSTGGNSAITGWIGYSSVNSDPKSGDWTWLPASFESDQINDDQYQVTLPSFAPGTYYVASRFQKSGGSYIYGGYGGIWNDDSGVVTVNSNTVDWANLQHPANATVNLGNSENIYGRVYEPGVTVGPGRGGGITVQLGYSTTNSNPQDWTNWIPASYNVNYDGSPYYDNNNDEYMAPLGSTLPAGIYYYAYRYQKNGSTEYKYGGYNSGGGGFWDGTNNISGVLTVVDTTPVITFSETLGALSTTFGTASSANSFSVSGNNLTSNVTVSAPSGFEISTNASFGYDTNVVLSISGNSLPSTNLFLRLAATTAVGTYSGNVTAVSGTTTATLNHPASTVYPVSSYNNGDYRTILGTGLLWSDANHWQKFNGLTWNNAGADGTPSSIRTVYIRGTMSTNGPQNANKIIIENGGKLIVSGQSTSTSQTWVKSGGTLQLEAVLKNSGNFEVQDNGIVKLDGGSTNYSSLWLGTEKFDALSLFEVNYANKDNKLFKSANDISTNPETKSKFGKLIIQPTTFNGNGNWTYILPNDLINTEKVTADDFVINNSTDRNFTLNGTEIVVGGNLMINISGAGDVAFQSENGSKILTVYRNLTRDGLGAGIFRIVGSGTNILNIYGNLHLKNNLTRINASNSASTLSTINLKGDLVLSGTATLDAVIVANNSVNFTGDGANDTNRIQKIDLVNQTTNGNINYYLLSGASVRIVNQNLALGNNSTFTVNNGSALDFGFDAAGNPLNLTRSGTSTNQSFELKQGGTLKITSPQGIVNASTEPAAEKYKGNVRIGSDATKRIFSPGATYHYIGKTDQTTGNGVPDGITGKLIVELETDPTLENLTFTSHGTTTFGTSSGTNGLLEIRKGKVIDEPLKGFRNYNGTVDENNDGEADPQKGDVTMSGGRYVVSGGGTKPSLSGTYSLTGGTVEFAGSAATKIRVKPQFYNVDVSGTNVTAGGKNLYVKNRTSLTSTGKLTIPETVVDTDASYVLTSLEGVSVAAGGQLIFGNNAQLMEDADAVNSGEMSMHRNIKLTSGRKQYNYLISPVVGQNLKTIFNNNAALVPYVLYYNEATDFFGNSLGTYIKGRALAVKEPADSYSGTDVNGVNYGDAVFKGNIMNESFEFPLAYSGFLNGHQRGYNLVGNPYPSNIDLDKLYKDYSTSIESTFRFWDSSVNELFQQQGPTYGGSSYAIYNAATGTTTGTGLPAPGNGQAAVSGLKTPNKIVKPGQGFMVRAVASGAKINFNNALRLTSNTAANFFGKEEIQDDKYRIRLTSPSGIETRMAVVYFSTGNNAPGIEDSEKRDNTSDAIFSIIEGNKYLINGKSSFVNTDVVQLGTAHFTDGIYQISLEAPEGIFANGQKIYLKDKQTGTLSEISENGHSFYAPAGEQSGRFEIIYKPETVLTTDDVIRNGISVYRYGEDFVIKSVDQKIVQFEVFDMSGRSVKRMNGAAKEMHFSGRNLLQGIYVVKVILQDGAERSVRIRN